MMQMQVYGLFTEMKNAKIFGKKVEKLCLDQMLQIPNFYLTSLKKNELKKRNNHQTWLTEFSIPRNEFSTLRNEFWSLKMYSHIKEYWCNPHQKWYALRISIGLGFRNIIQSYVLYWSFYHRVLVITLILLCAFLNVLLDIHISHHLAHGHLSHNPLKVDWLIFFRKTPTGNDNNYLTSAYCL